MTLEEIIKKQKEHLTKAQIGELIQATERYKQLNASNRASAMRTLSDQYRATRRGLQNTGLAGRKGKLVSGQEKAARIRANEAYRSYNAGLRQIDNAYAQNRAARMSYQNAQANQLAETERIQAENDKEAARINAEYEAWIRKKKAAEEALKRRQEAERARLERAEKERLKQMEQARQDRQDALYDAMHPGSKFDRRPQTIDEGRAENNQALIRQQRAAQQGAARRQAGRQEYIYDYLNGRAQTQYEAPIPERLRKLYEEANANEERWDAAIKRGNLPVPKNKEHTYESNDADKARREKAANESAISREVLAGQYPQYAELLRMSDEEFAVAYYAAKTMYARYADDYIAPQSEGEAARPISAEQYNKSRIAAPAVERFAAMENAKRLRDESSTKAYYYDTFGADESLVPKKPSWMRSANSSGPMMDNWKTASKRGWSASDYKGKSKYDALVNEWSLLNGPTYLLATQTHKTNKFMSNVRDLLTASGLNTDAAYNWFVDECLSEFWYRKTGNKNYITGGEGSQHIDMEAMLTLANLMTDEERARFNTILRDGSAAEADKYFEYLYNEVLPQRYLDKVNGENRFQTRDSLGRLRESLISVPNNISEGIGGVGRAIFGTNRTNDPSSAMVNASRNNTAQSIREAVGSHYSGVGNFLYQTGMSMADSATVGMISGGLGSAFSKLGMPAKWASRAGSVLGGSILGGSAYNSAYAEALQRGLSPDKARATALGQGFNEMLFESLSLDLLVSQFQKGGILKVSKNGFVNWVVNTLVQGGVEGSEEVFTDIANSLWDKHINGIYSEELTKLREYIAQGMSYEEAKRKVADEFNEQLGMSFLGGAISGGVMGGGASFLGMLQGHDVAKIGRNLDDAAKAEIREYDFKNEEAKEILTGKLTDEDYGRLAMTRLEEMAQTDPVAAEKAAQALIDATARTDVKVDKRNQTLKTGTENTVSFNYDGVTDVKKMSGVQVEALRFAQTLVKSKVGGVNINVANQLYDKNGNEQNGWYDAKTNTVHVSLNGSQSVVYTISHELTHRLKDGNAEAYASMRDAMKSELESLDLTGSDLPSDYSDILGDYLVKDGVQRTAWEALVNYEMDRYAKHGIELSREAAEEEVVCRACETMLEKSRLISSMVSRNVRSAKKIAKLLASIYDDIASLKAEAESRGYEDGSPEKMFIDQYTDIEKIANAWAAAMKGVSEKEGKRKPRTERIAKSKNGDYARLSKSETAKASGNIDVTADVVAEGENGKPLSIKSLDFDMHSGKMYKDLVEHGVMTEEEVVKFDRFLKDLVAYIKPNRAFLDMNESYTKDNRPFTAFKDNSDPLYKLSLDFSTLCRKRLTTQYIIEKLQLKLKKALSAEEQLAVRDMLKQYQKIDNGLQVACGMCYVEAARYKSPKQINMWLESDGRRKAMTQYFAVTDKQFTETVKQKQAEWKVQHGYADNATKDAMSASDRNAFNRMSYDLRQSYEMDAEHQAILDKALSLPKEQFLSAANLAELAEGDEAERTIYNAYTRFIRAATRSKSLEADIPYYYGDSESRVSDTFVKNVNAENGMRFDSWSDFQFTHLLDMITAIADLSVRGSAMHGYTKFPEFVRMFGKTGAMFNLSGVPQGIGLKQDGSLDFSPTESINEEEAIKLREEFPETAGFQSIGINDRHINALLDSDFIDYVIPYHVSGMNAKLRSIAKIAGWSNYQDVQNAKIDHSLDGNKAKCDPAVWHVEPVFSEFFVGYNTGMSGIDAMRASAQRYVDMCHERGLKPKFEKFLDNANYWKLLIDRKMINQKTGALIEQKAVKPNFDLNTIKREIDKYVNSYDQNREENAFNYIVDRWDEVPALVAKLEKEGRAEKKRQQEAAKNIDMLKGEMVNAMPGRLPLKAAAQKFSIKESDAQYMDLARRYESGDKSVEAELRKAVDAAAKAAGYTTKAYHGTSAQFTVFDKAKIGSQTDDGIYGRGFYFSTNKEQAAQYGKGKAPMRVYLNVGNQLLLNEYDNAADLAELLDMSDENFVKDNSTGILRPTYSKVNQFTSHVKNAGYNSVKADYGTSDEIVIFDGNRAKSADLITKDDSGNIIPLSERFKTDRTGEDAWKNEDIRYSKMDKVRLSTADGTRTFTLDGVTAKMDGNDVTLDGGKVRQRVQMMEAIAEVNGTARVDAASEEEAEAFRRAGAEQVVEELEGHGAKYGTWEFKYEERKFTNDSRYDIKQKQKFAKDILKQVGKSSGFTQAQRVKYGAALGRLMDYLWEMQYGKMDGKVIFEFADRLFDSILNDYTALSEADEGFRSELLANMTKTKNAKGSTVYVLEVNDKQMREIKYAYENAMAYASKLSKALGVRVTVKQTENAKTLEDIFTNSTDTRIKSDTNEGDMPGELLRLAQETESRKTNPYAAESEERQALKEGMFYAAMDAAGVEKSTAQQIREAVKETRKAERTKAKTEAKKAIDSARLAERMHEGALRAKDRRISENRERALKQHAADREAKLKQGFRETTQKANETRLKRDMRTIALKWNQRLVKMLANQTESSHVPVQLAREVAELTKTITEYLDNGTERGRINLDKVIKAYQRAFDDQATIAEAQRENPHYDPRGTVIDREMYDEYLVQMMNRMNEIVTEKSFKDLSSYEMKALLDIVRGVAHTVYDANRMIGTSEHRAYWEVGDTMIHQFEDAPDVKLKGYLETSLDLLRLAKIFSGSNDNAEFVKLVERLNDGAIEKERIAQVLQDIFAPVTEKYGDEIRKWYGKKAEWIDTGITQNGKKVEITKGMRVSLAMHVLNAGNMNHIANGGITIPNREQYNKGKMTDAYANGETVQLSAEQIEEIISHMTEAEKAYVEAAKEFFHKRTGYYVNKTSLQLLGYRKATVENYFPIHTDKNFTKTDFASLQMDGSIEGQGFLKERVNASNPVYLEDITSVVNRQIRGVALYAGLAVPMRNFNAVMNSTEYFEDENGVWRPRTTVRKAMTQKMGEYGAKVVKGFLEDASEMSHVDVTPMERFAGKLATNYVKAVLLGNLKVAMKQVASYPTAAAVIPWKYLGKALLKGGRNHRLISRADVDLINQYTPLYRMRREGQANEIASIMAKRGMEQKLPWLLGWITKMDVMTVGRLWSAAEYMVADQQKNLPVGSDEYYKAVAKVFNDTIQQTQPNFTPLQRNAALRSKNPVVRSLVLFGTQRMQNGGILMEAAYELKHSKGKSKAEIKAAKMKLGRAVASQIVQNILLIVASLGVDALRGRMKSWQDEDKDITPESMMKGMGDMFLSNFIGSFLGGSETYSLFSGLFKKAMGETAYDTEFTVPALDAVETLINFAQSDVPSTIKYLLGDHTDEEKQKKAINFSYQLAKAFGYATGIPLENALKDVFKGIIPAIEDISDAIKTGELNLYLHQSGKLDNAKTAENYKEWTNLGKKGSVYLAWENRFKEDTSNGLDHRAELLFEDSALTADEKAIILRMSNSTKDNPLTSKDGVVYKEDGTVAVDFTNLDRYRASTMLSDKQYEGFLNLVDMGVAEDVASTAFIQYNVQKKQGSGANDRFRDWLFATVKNPEDRAKVDMAVVGNTVRVEGTIGYKENGEVYADYSSKEMFDLYTSGKKQQKSDAIISTTDTPEAKAKAFADTDNDYHAKGGIVYNDKDKVVADFTSDEAYRASQMGETHYAKYNDAVKHGMSKENAILAVEKHKEITNDDDKDNATQYATWVFNTYKSANDRAIAGAIYSSKPVTIKDGRTYDENGYIYRDYTSAAWYKLSNRSLSKDGVNKRYEAAKLLEQDGYTAEQTVAAYVEMDKLSKKSEWQKWLKDHGYTNEQINIFLWSRGWAKLQ